MNVCSFAHSCILHNVIVIVIKLVNLLTAVCLFMTDQRMLILQQITASDFLLCKILLM